MQSIGVKREEKELEKGNFVLIEKKERIGYIGKSFHLSLTFFQVLLYGLWQIKNSYYSAIKPKSAHYHLLSLFSV